LAPDVGRDKGPEHGFPIPMFPIKEKIKKVQETKVTGGNPWKSSLYEKLRKTRVVFNTPSFYELRKGPVF
jgi:hypothetical protein